MNMYKTAISALILAPLVGGISIHTIQNYMNVKEKAEQLKLASQEQVRQIETLLDEETMMSGADTVSEADVISGADVTDAVLRFHVRANSDSEEDQALKLLVRDGILEEMQPLLSEAESRTQAEQIMEEHLEEIKQAAEAIIQDAGYNYTVQAYLTEEEFPMKEYGDLRFPSGTYRALRVDIGKHEGANWWCVMYPGLCFVETTGGVVASEGKEELEKVLTAEEYAQILINPPEDAEIEYKSLFWENLKEKIGKSSGRI